MTLSELTREDYLGLKWHFVLLLLSIALVGGAFVYNSRLQDAANRQVNIARSDMNSAQNQLEQAEAEGETIGTYLERYADISAAGVVQGGDRLAMQERFAQIRARHNLFPIQLQIGSQSAFVLPPDEQSGNADGAVRLLTSEVRASLPLLHEDDLTRLLADIQGAADLVLTRDCNLRASSRSARDFLQLGQHMNAECSFLWYTFELAEASP